MTLQRQYILPNCSLIVEGLGGDDRDPMASLTVVLNTECKFLGTTDPLTGGGEFLDALVKAVSDYAQSVLSGIPYPSLKEAKSQEATEPSLVLLESGQQQHQLTTNLADEDGKVVPKTITLSTIQLFDLIEAIDQLLADTQTLPDMALKLSPLHRRHVISTEPVTQRVVPAAAGLSALAATAALLFVVPVPEVEPERPREEQAASTLVEGDTVARDTTEAGTTDTRDVDTDVGEPDTETPPSPDLEPADAEIPPTTDSDSADPAIAPAPSTNSVSAATALNRLRTAPEITDREAIARLEIQLEETLERELPTSIPFEEPLEYRVGVSESGDLLGYKYENEPGLEHVDDTPLPELLFIPVEPEQAVEEPVAQFRITFEPDGEVTAEPLSFQD